MGPSVSPHSSQTTSHLLSSSLVDCQCPAGFFFHPPWSGRAYGQWPLRGCVSCPELFGGVSHHFGSIPVESTKRGNTSTCPGQHSTAASDIIAGSITVRPTTMRSRHQRLPPSAGCGRGNAVQPELQVRMWALSTINHPYNTAFVRDDWGS